MGIFSNCLLVSDIDGTLKDRSCIPKINLEMIEYFKSQGGIFTIATGRGPSVAKDLCKSVNINGPALMSNGSVIYDVYKEEIIEAKYLPYSAKELTKAVMDKFQNVGIQITLDDKLITLADNIDTESYRERMGVPHIPVSFEEAKDIPWIKVLVMASDKELLSQVKEFMNNRVQDDFCFIPSSPDYYEVHVAGVSKARNLKRLLEVNNIPNGKVFCIGDYYNDLEMIIAADIGAALEDSPDDIKECADYIACNVKKGAVADFIKHLENKLKNNSKG